MTVYLFTIIMVTLLTLSVTLIWGKFDRLIKVTQSAIKVTPSAIKVTPLVT